MQQNKSQQKRNLDVDWSNANESWNSVLPVQLRYHLLRNSHRRHDAKGAAFADAFFDGNGVNFLTTRRQRNTRKCQQAM
jgi:hypothetical protein